jgi:carbon starvation protein
MNSAAIILGSIVFLAAGYFFYAKILEKSFEIDPANVTPAHKHFDGIDYVPARHWIALFSHHFASIAGAGPIVGPVIAAAILGFWPALLWIVFGTIFLGGVHDFAAIVISIRHNARSVADITGDVISRRSKLIFLGFVWLALVLVIAVFTSVCAKTLVTEPKIVVPCFGLIFVALIVGIMLYRIKVGVFLSTLAGLILLVISIIIGELFPIDIGHNAFIVWSITLLS